MRKKKAVMIFKGFLIVFALGTALYNTQNPNLPEGSPAYIENTASSQGYNFPANNSPIMGLPFQKNGYTANQVGQSGSIDEYKEVTSVQPSGGAFGAASFSAGNVHPCNYGGNYSSGENMVAYEQTSSNNTNSDGGGGGNISISPFIQFSKESKTKKPSKSPFATTSIAKLGSGFESSTSNGGMEVPLSPGPPATVPLDEGTVLLLALGISYGFYNLISTKSRAKCF
jgi:hypothetical protein